MNNKEQRTHVLLAILFSAVAASAFAQTAPPEATANVEVDPITCWWRTTTRAVRAGEPFGLTLTCAVVETESTKVVPDLSRLDPAVVQLPPFEILSGTHPGDIKVPGRRFLQYDYKMRVIAEDSFGVDLEIPTFEMAYRIESKVASGDSVQGRDIMYSLPRMSIRLISLVPSDATDIREAPAAPFSAIESRLSKASVFQTVATLLFALAGFGVLVMLVGMIRRRTAKTTVIRAHLHHRAIIAGAARELADVQRESRGGWSPELSGRALAAIRIVGSYATGRAVGQQLVEEGTVAQDGQLLISGGLGRAKALVSGSVTAESAGTVPGLADALRTLTIVRYGRVEKVQGGDEAVETGLRIAKQQASKHSVLSEWARAFVDSIVDLRKKVWA